jgi:phosphoribosyl 1,2-cyclic phosphate phosphodiesterase
VCRSTDPRDHRTRPSILIELRNDAPSPFAAAVRSILVDTSTDLRAQALANAVARVDAILYTHAHADHVFGIDETRRYNQMQKSAIACYAAGDTAAHLRRMFTYIFSGPRQVGGGVPQLRLFDIEGPFDLGGVEIVPLPLLHGELPVLGYRLGAFAYLRLGVDRAYFTHICHDLPHAATCARLPAGIELAYDGLVVEI